MPDQNIIQAMRGSSLTAADYAGMTPEQMQAVHGAGMQNKQMALGIWQHQQGEARHQRQESFQREQFRHQKEVSQTQMELAQRQDVRQERQRVTDNMFKMAAMEMQEKQFKMAQEMQSSNLAMNSVKMGQLKVEMETLQQQQDAARRFFQDKEFTVEGIPMSGAEATLMGFTPLQLMELKLKESAAKQANPVAWRQKQEYFEDMAMKLGVQDPIDVMSFALIASEGTGTITKDQIMDLKAKNDILFNTKSADEQVAIVNDLHGLFAESNYTDHRALAELFKRDNPEAAAALEQPSSVEISGATPQQPFEFIPGQTASPGTPEAAGESPAPVTNTPNQAVVDALIQESLGEKPADVAPVVEAFGKTAQPAAPVATQTPKQDAPKAEPTKSSEPPKDVPLEQSSGIINRTTRVRMGSTQQSVGTPKEVVREDGKIYLEYSNGFRQEIQQGWRTRTKATGRPIYEITFLDGSTDSFRI